MWKDNKRKMPVVYFLSIGYSITILIGTILLMLPFASKNSTPSFIDALLTSTSATCVTGLVPFDTFTNWSLFGQIVILLLIQIGGLGFMTIITLIFMLFKKKIGLYERTVLMQSAGAYSISNIVRLIRRILLGTLLFEGLGAILLTIGFWKDYGIQAIYYGIFHSISAFCNAGFDIIDSATGSLTPYYNNYLINFTIMGLIIIGGSGFIVWSDLLDHKFRLRKCELHTKIVVVFNIILIFIPSILFFIFEFTNIGTIGTYTDYSLSEKLLCSLFLSVSPRTAGFNTVNLNSLTSSSKLLTIILMFIGGNPGSTAGGFKVTTFVIVFASLFSEARGKKDVTLFNRRISKDIIQTSCSLLIAYLTFTLLSTLIIGAIEAYSLEEILFEVVSAVGTVGLSIGITSSACVITKVILIILMYAGRLGAFTLFSLFLQLPNEVVLKKPEGKVLVG